MITRGIVRPIVGGLAGNTTAAELFSSSVAFIGDSRIYDSEYEWKNVTFPGSTGGLSLSVGFCTGQGITADSVGGGSLEYRASDANLRWTAPGDTAGPWTPMFAGWNILESGTAGKGVRIGVRSVTGLPGTDQTISVSVIGVHQDAWRSYGFGARAMNFLRWLNESPKFLGLGGNTTAQVIEQLPWLQSQASGGGYDIFQLSTNDISNSTALATITANLTQIFDARRALGRRLVIVGEPARWGVNTSTPLTAGQQAILDGVNAFMASYAAANGAIFVDAYALTVDTGFSDKRPKAGVLRDTVHYSDLGAQIVGSAVANAIASFTGLGAQRASGSPGNLLGTAGYMTGAGGTTGTGASGTVPTSWTISRVTGSDATAVCSVADRTDGVAGRWMVLNVSATSGGQVIQAALTGSSLASLGLSAGDEFYLEAELDISSVSGGLVECDVFALLTPSTPATYSRPLISTGNPQRQDNEASVRRSPPLTVPSWSTTMNIYLWVRTQDVTSATIKMGSVAVVKL